MKKVGLALLSITASTGLWLAAQAALQGLEMNADALRVNPSKFSKVVENPKNKEAKKDILAYDSSVPLKWGLENTESQKAWRISKGSRQVTVAVIDTGADINHASLKSNVWTNPGETGKDVKGHDKATNGIDDDRNGFIDDVHGWNFVASTNDLTDNDKHGTHVSGIIGADGSNGVSGVAPQVSLMILKYYDSKSSNKNHLENTVKAIRYAVKMGANIINYSGGGLSYSAEEFEAIKEARNKGVLFVAAAGNERANSDYFRYYPANYPLDNIISVTAINPALKVLPSSNYGETTVHLAAPGDEVYSTIPGGGFGPMTGTSQASPFVTGVAVLLMANNPSLKYDEVKKTILATGDQEQSLLKKTGTSRRLNSYRALATLDQGYGLTGVKAANVQSQPGRQFGSDRFSPTGTDDVINDFSRKLLQRLQNNSVPAGT